MLSTALSILAGSFVCYVWRRRSSDITSKTNMMNKEWFKVKKRKPSLIFWMRS